MADIQIFPNQTLTFLVKIKTKKKDCRGLTCERVTMSGSTYLPDVTQFHHEANVWLVDWWSIGWSSLRKRKQRGASSSCLNHVIITWAELQSKHERRWWAFKRGHAQNLRWRSRKSLRKKRKEKAEQQRRTNTSSLSQIWGPDRGPLAAAWKRLISLCVLLIAWLCRGRLGILESLWLAAADIFVWRCWKLEKNVAWLLAHWKHPAPVDVVTLYLPPSHVFLGQTRTNDTRETEKEKGQRQAFSFGVDWEVLSLS